MFRKKQTKDIGLQSVRNRKPAQSTSESFRRNAVVFSRAQKELATHQQSVTQRQLERKHKLARQKLRIKLVVTVIAVFLGALAFRMSLSSVRVESNASSRLSAAETAIYAAAIEKLYKSHTLAGQWWLVDTESLSRAVTQQFPEIERVVFKSSAPLTTDLHSELRFRTPVFTWYDAANQQQFVDKNGVLFAKNLNPSVNTAKLIKIEDQSGIVLDEGSPVLTQSLIQFIGQLHAKLPLLYAKDAKITRVIIPRSTREVQVQVSGQPYIIKFSSSETTDQQVGELGSLLTFLKSQNKIPAEYIDMRVPHKAFYK